MRRLPVALLSLGVSVLVAACSTDNGTTAPRSISSRQASADVHPATSTCDFSAVTADARAFFKKGSDPVFGYINDMQSAFNKKVNGGATAATPFVWPILKQIATERLTAAQGGTADNGAQLVIDAFNCTTYSADLRLLAGGDFVLNGSLAISAGIFEVRGDAANAAPARAYLSSNGRVAATPVWGVQAPTSGWPTTGGAFLIYGYPKLLNASGVATFINTNGPTSYDAFELGKIPTHAVDGLLVGICTKAVTSDNGTLKAGLLVHASQRQLNASPTTLCNTAIVSTEKSWTSRVKNLVASVLSPAAAIAQDFSASIGGLPSDWSPFTTGTVLPGKIYLSFSTQQTDGTVNTPLTVVVQATDSSVSPPVGAPVVVITLSIAGNNGQPAMFKKTSDGSVSSTATVVTDASGSASFSGYTLTKAGGYTITATGSVGGVAPAANSITSALFNIQNK